MRGMILALCPLIAICAGPTAARAAVQYSGSYSAVATQHSPTSDTSLSDPDWVRGEIAGSTSSFEDLTTRSAAPFKTAAYVLYDARNLYVAFDIQQATPITANQTTNNVGFGLDDFVGIGIDTSGNGSTVYYFETTPRGTRYQQASENSRYNPVWRATAKIGKGGWVAVMTIPLNAIHHNRALMQTWRFNFVRGVAATNEHYTWAFDGTMQDGAPPGWPAFSDAQFWPHLGIRLSGSGDGFGDRARADAYVLGSAGADRKLFAQANGTFKPESARMSGLDVSYALTQTIHFVATLNPDFSNVEVDQQTKRRRSLDGSCASTVRFSRRVRAFCIPIRLRTAPFNRTTRSFIRRRSVRSTAEQKSKDRSAINRSAYFRFAATTKRPGMSLTTSRMATPTLYPTKACPIGATG